MIDYSKIYVNDFNSYDNKGNERKIVKKFKTKIMYAPYDVKKCYNELKNIFLKYGFKDKYTTRFETFKKNDLMFRFNLNRTSFKLYLNQNNEESKYHIKYTDSTSLEKTPYFIKLKSDRSLKFTKELVLNLINERRFREVKNFKEVDYLPLLIPNGEVIMQKLGLKDYYLYDDITLKNIPKDIPYSFEKYVPVYHKPKNEEKVYHTFYIDELCDIFDDYSVVSVETLQELNLMGNGNALRVKGRGKIDKKLIVFADEIDDEALRMIIHTNSTAVLVD
ncbi:MAG: hypothetical protein IJU60_00950 [Acholeplasmatales bacterium]|nr:hypothetical protein [Acholeplasmatales bacterium]